MRVFGHEAHVSAALCDPLGLDDLLGREGRAANVTDLPLVHEVTQRPEGLIDVDALVWSMYLIEVDVVGAESA